MLISLGAAAVRSFVPDDARLLARYASDPVVTAFMHDAPSRAFTVDEVRAWIDVVRTQTPECQFSIAIGAETIGGIGLELQRDIYGHSAELSYWIAEPYWRRGIATRAVGAVADHAFGVLGLHRLYARVFDGNDASQRVLQKCAFDLEGRLRDAAVKNGRYVDQILYAKLRSAH